MANPFVALESVPVMATITDMLQRQANLKQTETRTNIENAHLNLLNQEQDMNQRYRDALMKGATLDPTRNTGTPSIGETQDSPDSNDPAQTTLKALQADRQRMVSNIQLAQQYNQDPKPFVSALAGIDRDMREASNAVIKSKSDQAQQVGQVFRDVNSPESLRSAVDFVGTQFGKKQAQALEQSLPHDDQGNLVWNDVAKQKIAPFVSKAMTTHDQLAQQHWKAQEEEKLQADQIRRDDEKRKDKSTDSLVALHRAQEGVAVAREADIKEQTQVRKEKIDRVAQIASKPANESMKKSARSAVLASDPQAKWDDTIDAYSADVADRANKIRADEARGGKDLSLDDARQQAMEELSPFVTKKTKGGVNIPLVGHVGGDEVSTYTRSKSAGLAAPAAGAPLAMPATKEGLQKGKTYNTSRGAATWDGEKFVKTD